MRVLIVEDERRLADAVARGLRHRAMAVDVASEREPRREAGGGGGQPVELQPKEFAVLRVLLEADGGVVSSEELLARVWDENVDPFTNVVRVVVMTLRGKLGDPPLIETVTGAGYRIP